MNVPFLLLSALTLALAACPADPAPVTDCNEDPTICGEGTTCDTATGRCSAEAPAGTSCVDSPDICGAGTSCSAAGICEPDPVAPTGCDENTSLCAAGTACNADTGICEPVTNCNDAPELCGTDLLCAADGRCLPDCRDDLVGGCGDSGICNRESGACEDASTFDCRPSPAFCLSGQTCDDATGYCLDPVTDPTLPLDVQLYDMDLSIDTSTDTFDATVKLVFTATANTTAELVLDAARIVVPGTVPYEVGVVTDAEGNSLSFDHDLIEGTLAITLPQAPSDGETVVLTIIYDGDIPAPVFGGSLPESGLVKLARFDGEVVYTTIGWPDQAKQWLPSPTAPNDVARAFFRIQVDDATQTIIANGAPFGPDPDAPADSETARFGLLRPVPTYALHVTVGPYERFELGVISGVRIGGYAYPGDGDRLKAAWADVLGAFGFFTDMLGEYEFSHFAMVQHPLALGAMEHATVVSIGELFTTDPDEGRTTVIHELSHHWFGDNTYIEAWKDFWLNESLAVYWTTVYFGTNLTDQFAPPTYQEYLNAVRTSAWQLEKSAPYISGDALYFGGDDTVVPEELTAASAIAPYYKGPWIWHMVRTLIGDDDVFWAFQRALYQDNRFGSYSTAGVQAQLEGVASDVDWTTFFDEWIYGQGWPQIEYSWTYDVALDDPVITATQVQDADWGVYTLAGPLSLVVVMSDDDDATNDCLATIEFTGGATEVMEALPCDYEPTRVEITLPDRVFMELTAL